MAKDFSPETKIKLCRLYWNNTASDKFNYSRFINELVLPNPRIRIYAPLLFIYGTNLEAQYAFVISDEAQTEFQIQDRNYYMWVKLCEQIKFLFEKGVCDFYYSQHDYTKKQIFSLYNQKSLQTEILKILINDLCQFENDIANDKKTVPANITLQSINERLEDARIEKEKVFGINRGRPTPISVLQSHFIIQGLSCLLRIDKLIKLSDETKNIIDIQLEKVDYEFIYDFLSYFNLLAYEASDNTTTKADLIEQRF